MEQLKALAGIFSPDERSGLFVMTNVRTGESRPRTIADHHREAAAAVLATAVPEHIRSLFATAQNLVVYAWVFYPFHMSAQMQALACVEFALRERLKPTSRGQRGFRSMLEQAVSSGLITDAGFKLFPAPPSEVRQIWDGRKLCTVHSYSEVLIITLPRIRNDLAHGATTLHEGSPTMLLVCADIINQLFESGDHGGNGTPPHNTEASKIS